MITDINAYSIKDLNRILNNYPWFTLARHALFTKMTYLGEEYYEEGYRITAPYVYSREKLYWEHQAIAKKLAEEKNSSKPIDTKIPDIEEFPIIDLSQDLESDIIRGNADLESTDTDEQSSIPSEEDASSRDIPKDISQEVLQDISKERPEEEEKSVMQDASQENPKEANQGLKSKEFVMVGGDYFSQKDFKELKKDGLSTIERFKPNKNEHKVKDFEKRNLPQEYEYYTETLAQIYYQQDLFAEAIDVYSKLILLYPEKSAYFASLIVEIKKNII